MQRAALVTGLLVATTALVRGEENTPGICGDGFYQAQELPLECRQCRENCKKCTAEDTCTECSANFETIRNEENKITECKRNGATLAGSATLAVLASFAAATLAALI